MLSLSTGIRVFVCTQAADMRKGFDGRKRPVAPCSLMKAFHI